MSVVRRVLEKFRLNEISAVDRPAQAHATMTIMKRADALDDAAYQALCKRSFTADERRKAAASGTAMPDGSYPIENKGDLQNAIHAIGRGTGSLAAVQEHIGRRAQALGATDLLPDDWNAGKRLPISTADDGALCIEHDGDPELSKALDAYARCGGGASDRADFIRYLTQRGYRAADCEKVADRLAAVASGPVAAGNGTAGGMSEKHKAFMESRDAKLPEGGKDAFAAMSPAERDSHIENNPLEDGDVENAATSGTAFKSVGGQLITKRVAGVMFDVLKSQDDEIRKSRDALAKAAEEQASAEFAKRAGALGFGSEFGSTLRKAYGGDAAAQAEVEQRITGLKKQVEEGALFGSFGKSTPQGDSAEAELRSKAEDLRRADPKLSSAQAFAKVYEDRANAEVVKRYKAERAAAH
jgi:hypothetical protein